MAAWIARERKRLGLKPPELAERIRAHGGLIDSWQTIRVWESYAKRNPSPDNIAALERVFGTAAPDPESAVDIGTLIAKLDAQTGAITELARAVQMALGALGIEHGNLMHALGIRLGQPEKQPDPEPGTSEGTPQPADQPTRGRQQ